MASGNAAVTAASCLDDPTSTTLAITSDCSVIKTGVPDLAPNGQDRHHVRRDRTANTTYLKVVVTDTAAPVFALIQPGLTHQSMEGSVLSDPGATCSDTCDKAIAAPIVMWTATPPHSASHAGCTENNVVGGTIMWARDKRAQKHGAWNGKEVGECTCTHTRTDAAGNTHYSQRKFKFIVVHNDQPVTAITESHRKCNEIQCQPRVISLLLLTALHLLQTRAKGVGGGGRAIAKLMLVMGMVLEVAAAGGTCTGASVGLAADQCAAWGQFWDGAGGPNWDHHGQGCTKIDPCGSCPTGFVACSGSSITTM
jgi:hypothetical protein